MGQTSYIDRDIAVSSLTEFRMPHLTHVHVGLLRETFPDERRVALTPSDVGRLSGHMPISFEPGCGAAAAHPDEAYVAAGAKPAGIDDIAERCTVIAGVRRPDSRVHFARAAALIFLGSPLDPGPDRRRSDGIVELDLSRLEGMADAGSMDVATTQATIAGHAAVLEGARQLGVVHPMLVLDGAFVRPVRMAVLGTGAAALQAIATARRLGALTYAFGFFEGDKAKVELLGARFIAMDPALSAATGFASASRLAECRRQLADQLAPMQLIVSSVHGAGGPAPVLIDERTAATLEPGTVIIDLAASGGGNCAMTQMDRPVMHGGVRVLGSTTFSSAEAGEASRLFGEGVRKLLEKLTAADGRLLLDHADPVLRRLIDWRIGAALAAM